MLSRQYNDEITSDHLQVSVLCILDSVLTFTARNILATEQGELCMPETNSSHRKYRLVLILLKIA